MTIDEKLDYIVSNMATKDDIRKLDNELHSVDAKIDKMEHDTLNTCLGYTDEQNETIMAKLDNIQTTLNTAARLKTIDNDVYNLVSKRLNEVEERVEQLERIS